MLIDFCSYNIRGLNSKLAYVKDFLSINKISFFALLETHVKQELATALSSFVAPHFKWCFNYDHHSNGRIWLGWDTSKWDIVLLSQSAQQISCNVTCLESKMQFFVSIVYAYNTYSERRILWNELDAFKKLITSNGVSSPWILAGDFNSYMKLEESVGSHNFWTTSMLDFKDCICNLGVTDLRATGQLHTWWDGSISNPVQRKLDRVMVNDTWLDLFPMSHASFLPRGISDHSPAAIHLGILHDKMLKPFQLYAHLLLEPSFLSEVKEAWDTDIVGDPWFVLTSKMKRVKAAMIKLNNSKGNLHSAVDTARNNLNQFQASLPLLPNAAQRREESNLISLLNSALSQEEVLLKQKSRVNWLKNGDGNNRYFFNACKGRWNRNKILTLEDADGINHTTHKGIAKIAVDHFKNQMGSAKIVENFADVQLPMLTESQKQGLVLNFSDEDILKAFKDMAGNKSPGPDGFSPEFFVQTWNVIGKDVTTAIKWFFCNLHLPRIINSTAIALIPKQDCPTKVQHFRPISCCNVLYKCIAKLIASRLKMILPEIISPYQAAFVPTRSIGDNIILAQALCRNYHHKSGARRCTFKLDISKAFDSLDWSFLFTALEKMGFPQKFLNWVRACITSSMLSIKINGVLEGYFKSESGLRQGDPLSPYLFVLAMEVLTACIRKFTCSVDFKHHLGTKELDLSHLIFADDVLLFSKGDLTSVKLLMEGVHLFSSISGLQLNLSKCSVFFSKLPDEIRINILEHTGFTEGSLPITYLGLPLISGKLNSRCCTPLVQRLCDRIDKWTCRFLSIAGRLQLIKSILFAIQGYWSMYLFLPKNVLKKIQQLLANFLWGGTASNSVQHKVSWEDCCLPMSEGGLGIRNVLIWNQAAIFYQLWRTLKPSNSIWITWFREVFLKNKAFWTMDIPHSCSWCITKILKARVAAKNFIHYIIGNNSNFLLWHDLWSSASPLIDRYSFVISELQSHSFAEVGTILRGTNWNLPPSNHVLVMELRDLFQQISIGQVDSITWDGKKMVKITDIWDSIRHKETGPNWLPAVWHPWAIKKCSIFLWLAFKNRLLTKQRMVRFGMSADPYCLFCSLEEESIDHLILSCPYSSLILGACPIPLRNTWDDLLNGNFFRIPASKSRAQISYLFLATAVHSIWLERNARLHGKSSKGSFTLLLEIKRKTREKLHSCTSFKKESQKDSSLILDLY